MKLCSTTYLSKTNPVGHFSCNPVWHPMDIFLSHYNSQNRSHSRPRRFLYDFFAQKQIVKLRTNRCRWTWSTEPEKDGCSLVIKVQQTTKQMDDKSTSSVQITVKLLKALESETWPSCRNESSNSCLVALDKLITIFRLKNIHNNYILCYIRHSSTLRYG